MFILRKEFGYMNQSQFIWNSLEEISSSYKTLMSNFSNELGVGLKVDEPKQRKKYNQVKES
jgi:hypothetical protein